jgi:hypothetical protein
VTTRRDRHDIAEQTRRGHQLAGPVTVARGLHCECGQLMRPGVDHTCDPAARADLADDTDQQVP